MVPGGGVANAVERRRETDLHLRQAASRWQLTLRLLELLDRLARFIPTPARTETYAVSAGEMTLIAALRDAASGELLTRVHDHEAGPELGPMKLMTHGENISEA